MGQCPSLRRTLVFQTSKSKRPKRPKRRLQRKLPKKPKKLKRRRQRTRRRTNRKTKLTRKPTALRLSSRKRCASQRVVWMREPSSETQVATLDTKQYDILQLSILI